MCSQVASEIGTSGKGLRAVRAAVAISIADHRRLTVVGNGENRFLLQRGERLRTGRRRDRRQRAMIVELLLRFLPVGHEVLLIFFLVRRLLL